MPDRKRLDALLVSELSGAEKIAALLLRGGRTYTEFARAHSLFPPDVTATVKNRRRSGDVCRAIATELAIPLEEIEALLDAEPVSVGR